MRVLAAGVGMVLGLCAVGGKVEAFSASYDQKVTQGGQVVTGKVILRDQEFRFEATVNGQDTVTVRNASGTYTYLVKEGIAMKMSGLDSAQQPIQHAGDYQQYLQERHAERIGTETVDGYRCDVYRFVDPSMPGTATAWVWTEKQFPLKVEINGSNGNTVIELTNIQLGVDASDATFQLPAGAQVMDMDSLMNARGN